MEEKKLTHYLFKVSLESLAFNDFLEDELIEKFRVNTSKVVNLKSLKWST